jgi:hypothetical protein
MLSHIGDSPRVQNDQYGSGEQASSNSAAGAGVFGESATGEGVRGFGHSNDHGAVVGTNSAAGPGIYARSERGDAGFFDGNVQVRGTLKVNGTLVDVAQLTAATQGLAGTVTTVQKSLTTLQQQANTLQQQVNNLQQQEVSLQQKEAGDVQGIAVSLATLAARVTALGG